MLVPVQALVPMLFQILVVVLLVLFLIEMVVLVLAQILFSSPNTNGLLQCERAGCVTQLVLVLVNVPGGFCHTTCVPCLLVLVLGVCFCCVCL